MLVRRRTGMVVGPAAERHTVVPGAERRRIVVLAERHTAVGPEARRRPNHLRTTARPLTQPAPTARRLDPRDRRTEFAETYRDTL